MSDPKRVYSVPNLDAVCDGLEKTHLEFQKLVNEKLREVMRNREEIMEAFVAKYGFQPDEAMQYEQRRADGTTVWFVGKRVKDGECVMCGRKVK